MKKQLFPALLCLIYIAFGCTSFDVQKIGPEDHDDLDGFTDYYWYDGRKIPLVKSEDKYFAIFESGDIQSLEEELRSKNIAVGATQLYEIPLPKTSQFSGRTRSFTPGNKLFSTTLTRQQIESADENGDLFYKVPNFFTASGAEAPISSLFYVFLNDEKDFEKLEALAGQHNVEIESRNEFDPLWYTLRCSKNSSGNALEMANLFYETGYFYAAEPDFMDIKPTAIPNDYRYGQQWALPAINMPEAIDLTTGLGVVVAVIDEGVDMTHPDLAANIYRASYDAVSGTSPSRIYGAHGTPCAGIIGATHNTIGVAGIAPNVRVMSCSFKYRTERSNEYIANAIRYAVDNGADVLSCSWGGGTVTTSIKNAINHALNNGRGGKGCVVVGSSGNYNQSSVVTPWSEFDNSIRVGSVDRWMTRASYSNYGDKLDIVAPGVITISTNSRTLGYPNEDMPNAITYDNDLYVDFGGTSAACPHVAGVSALVLSANAGLTNIEVREIILKTAKKAGNYTYTSTNDRWPYGTWNREMGHGVVNAYDAVSAVLYPKAVIITPQGDLYMHGKYTFEIRSDLHNMNEYDIYWASQGGSITPNHSTAEIEFAGTGKHAIWATIVHRVTLASFDIPVTYVNVIDSGMRLIGNSSVTVNKHLTINISYNNTSAKINWEVPFNNIISQSNRSITVRYGAFDMDKVHKIAAHVDGSPHIRAVKYVSVYGDGIVVPPKPDPGFGDPNPIIPGL